MISLFTKNIPLTLLTLSLTLNIFLLFLSNGYRGDITRLEGDVVNREQSLKEVDSLFRAHAHNLRREF